MTCPVCKVNPDPTCPLCNTTAPNAQPYPMTVDEINAAKQNGNDLASIIFKFEDGTEVNHPMTEDNDDPIRSFVVIIQDNNDDSTSAVALGATSRRALAYSAALALIQLCDNDPVQLMRVGPRILEKAMRMMATGAMGRSKADE